MRNILRSLISRYSSIGVLAGIGLAIAYDQNGDESRANPTSKIFNAPPHTIVTSHTDPSSLENIGLPSIGDEKEASPNSIEQGARSVPDSEVARPKMVNHLPAIAQPANKADLTCLADGPLYELFVKEGQEVQTGDSLALIDNRVALASVSSAQASADRRAMLTSARAKVSLAEQYLQTNQQCSRKECGFRPRTGRSQKSARRSESSGCRRVGSAK